MFASMLEGKFDGFHSRKLDQISKPHFAHKASLFKFSLPFLFLILCMLKLASSRSIGNIKIRFVQEEADEWNAVRA
jgi:hypothetical protein